MGIELKINAENATELAQVIAGLAAMNTSAIAVAAQDFPPRAEKPALKSRAKAEPKPASEKEVAVAPEQPAKLPEEAAAEAQGKAGASAPTEGDVTYEDVRKAVLKLAAAKGRDAVTGVFEQFGVDHGTKLTSEQWAPALDALNAAMEA